MKRKRASGDQDKLVYQATKLLHRAAKKAKAFEVQKAVRRLKDARAKGRAGDETAVVRAKAADVDVVVAVALRRCGVANTGAAGEPWVEKLNKDAAATRVSGRRRNR